MSSTVLSLKSRKKLYCRTCVTFELPYHNFAQHILYIYTHTHAHTNTISTYQYPAFAIQPLQSSCVMLAKPISMSVSSSSPASRRTSFSFMTLFTLAKHSSIAFLSGLYGGKKWTSILLIPPVKRQHSLHDVLQHCPKSQRNVDWFH